MAKKDSAKIIELGELRSILSSQALRKRLQESRSFHQAKVNEHVRAKDLISAYGELCKLDYIDKFGSLVEKEYEKLTKEAEK